MIKTTASQAPDGAYCSLDRMLSAQGAAKELALFSNRPARSRLLGESRSRFRGRGMEFEEARPYAPGDDVRTIDWRVTARTGIAHTKLFREERERPVHILVDQRSTMFFGSDHWFKSAWAAEAATLVAWSALQNADRIGGQIIGDSNEADVRARRSRHAVLGFIRELNRLNHMLGGKPESAPKLASMLEECRRLGKPGTTIFIFSDFLDFDEDCRKTLTLMGRHCDLCLFQVRDPLELELPAVGSSMISNGRERMRAQLQGATLRRLRQQLEQQQELLKQATHSARGRLLLADLEQSPLAYLRGVFGK